MMHNLDCLNLLAIVFIAARRALHGIIFELQRFHSRRHHSSGLSLEQRIHDSIERDSIRRELIDVAEPAISLDYPPSIGS